MCGYLTGMDRRDDLTQLPPSGFYSEDPTDLLNSVLTLPIDLPGVQVRLSRLSLVPA